MVSLLRHDYRRLNLVLLLAPALLPAIGCSSKSNPVPAGPVCPDDADLISDFAMDNGVHPVDGRQGGWYTYGDHSGLGTLIPAEGTRAMPDLTEGNTACSMALGSLHVSATNFTDWGAAMGVDFKPKVTGDAGVSAKGTYDASKYKGISFWAKAKAPVKLVQVKFTDPYTEIPSVLSMSQWCDYQPMMPAINCSPYIVKFGYGSEADPMVAADYPKYASAKIDVTWKYFEILFADTKQDRYNPGRQSPGNHLDVTQLMGMAVQVNSIHSTPTTTTANDFELWLDDVAFVK